MAIKRTMIPEIPLSWLAKLHDTLPEAKPNTGLSWPYTENHYLIFHTKEISPGSWEWVLVEIQNIRYLSQCWNDE